MGKEVGPKHQPPPITQTTPTQKAIPTSLKAVSENTSRFMTQGRGQTMLGAGKPPMISNRAPQKASNRVSQAAANSHILPLKKPRTK